ncbi:MAG TPA: xanthine dehydrogenase family protein molybdopterin-binding subunit [Acidimicrobiia bacterium]|nr:xanthine dehydrogenase family protein molybdopterin-binding subunit [Acidimicrobiia bacterium]
MGRYLADLPGPALHAVFVRSQVAHGRVVALDTETARSAPGVVAVLTAADLRLGPVRGHPMLDARHARPPLASDELRFVGEPVAVVVAESAACAVDAAELVVVDVEELPVSVLADPDAEVAWELATADRVAVLGGAEVLVRGRFVNQRVAVAPMEADGAYAEPDGAGVVLWASTQRVHQVRDAVAASLGIDPALVRVRAPLVGGGFGGKYEPSVEAIVVAALARRLGCGVVWVQTRRENLAGMPHGRGQLQDGTLALDADGTFRGIWASLTGDAGAYPTVGALMPNATLTVLAGTYRFERAGGAARSVVTNTTPTGAYRGAGRPEASALVERLVDLAAARLGIDPVELRRRNLVTTFPHQSPTGVTYDAADYRACLEGAVARVDYDGVRAEQAARRAHGDPVLLGVGVAMWIDCTPMNRPGEWASLTLDAAGDDVRVVVRDGANDQGQAHATTWGLLLADRLELPVGAVVLEPGDTAHVPYGEGTGSARSTMLAGGAVVGAADALLEQARAVAASLLEASAADVVVGDDGRFSVAGVPAVSVSWLDLARQGPLTAAYDYVQSGPTFPAGCHAAVVEVDRETGAVRLVRFVAVDDCGTVVNPVVVAGQQQGGIVQGIAQALWEEVVYDERGNLLTSTFADYAIPSAAELPAIDVATTSGSSPVNVLGAKGIGQAGAIGSTVAVQNAVVDAVSHLGVRHIDLPLTSQRVWRAIMDAGASDPALRVRE